MRYNSYVSKIGVGDKDIGTLGEVHMRIKKVARKAASLCKCKASC